MSDERPHCFCGKIAPCDYHPSASQPVDARELRASLAKIAASHCEKCEPGRCDAAVWAADALARVSAPPVSLSATDREALDGIADYGWAYDGRTTFTVNCVGPAAGRRLQEFFSRLTQQPEAPDATLRRVTGERLVESHEVSEAPRAPERPKEIP